MCYSTDLWLWEVTFICWSVTYAPSSLNLFLLKLYGKFLEILKIFLDELGSSEIHDQRYMSFVFVIFYNLFHWNLCRSLPLSMNLEFTAFLSFIAVKGIKFTVYSNKSKNCKNGSHNHQSNLNKDVFDQEDRINK